MTETLFTLIDEVLAFLWANRELIAETCAVVIGVLGATMATMHTIYFWRCGTTIGRAYSWNLVGEVFAISGFIGFAVLDWFDLLQYTTPLQKASVRTFVCGIQLLATINLSRRIRDIREGRD